MDTLIFDCDGVLADTERDAHRVAFNLAFKKLDLNALWDVELYGKLLAISGGKERMRCYFDQAGWPAGVSDRDNLIRQLHQSKTEFFLEIIRDGQLQLRSGVERLVDEALLAGVILAVCSTSNEKAVNLLVEKLLGSERKSKFSLILAGDVVTKKKPDPEIYNLAKERLGLEGCNCMVIEDSRNGLVAAKWAGMLCVVTVSSYTAMENFGIADGLYTELGDPPGDCVTLNDLRRIMTAHAA